MLKTFLEEQLELKIYSSPGPESDEKVLAFVIEDDLSVSMENLLDLIREYYQNKGYQERQEGIFSSFYLAFTSFEKDKKEFPIDDIDSFKPPESDDAPMLKINNNWWSIKDIECFFEKNIQSASVMIQRETYVSNLMTIIIH